MSNLLLSKIGHVISEFPLAFKQTKEVKLFMTLLVKNEEGMLEEIYAPNVSVLGGQVFKGGLKK